LFSSPRAWRILDGVIAIVISILAITLAVKGISLTRALL
jgi:arginine exporter protein ArgO